MYKVGIIGAGLIGKKRASALPSHAKLMAVSDLSEERAQSLASSHGAASEKHWQSLIDRSDIDIVIVATSNDALVPCARAALKTGKHVLLEKPAGRNPDELKELISLEKQSPKTVRVGFNHRFHPAFQKAFHLLASEEFGPLLYIRARYGHGGRLGYEKEWRAKPSLSGGGELLDQGVHLIDLCRWLGGEFDLEYGRAKTFFWNMPVEDNGFLLLKSPDGKRSAFLHASCTEWKNLFDFEVFCQKAKIQVYGLGRSYGTEELRIYRMKTEMGPPDIEIQSFPEEDPSWKLEFESFLKAIEGQKSPIAQLKDALKALEIVYSTYTNSGFN